MAYTYPNTDLDRPDLLHASLGSNWFDVFLGSDQILALAKSRGRLGYQTQLDMQNAVDAVSRFTVNTYQLQHWKPLVLLESEKNTEEISLLRYGEDAVYGNQPTTGYQYKYGVASQQYHTFPLPAELAEAPYIFNRITQPSLSWSHGLDYQVDAKRRRIIFREDPFADSRVAVRDLFVNGDVSDREAQLWCFRAKLDVADIYTQFGYVLNLQLESADEYRDYINGVWDGIVQGAAGGPLADAIAALTDTPVVRNEVETVEHIQKDHRSLLIITDREAYRYPRNADAVVAVDDKVYRYQQLADTVSIYEFHQGTAPAELSAVTIPPGMLAPGFLDGITFENKLVPTTVTSDGIFTHIRFEIGGWPGDIERFWDLVEQRGIATPPTLAQLLDQRTSKIGEPTAESLPKEINPLEFLVANILRNNAFVVQIKVNQQGPNALGLQHSRLLQRLVPPHTGMLIIAELAADTEVITMEEPGTETAPGYIESPELGTALEPVTTEVIDGETMVTDASPSLQYVEGACI